MQIDTYQTISQICVSHPVFSELHPSPVKKKKAILTKLIGRRMFQTTKHLFDQTTKTHSMKGLKLSKI